MKILNTAIALAISASVAGLIAAGPAAAKTQRHHAVPQQEYETAPVYGPGPGYYEGQYEFDVDRSDRASSPYSGGGY